MKTNLFSRFRSLFRKAEPDYEYDEYDASYEYEGYSDVPTEEPVAEEQWAEDRTSSVTHFGHELDLPKGAGVPTPEPQGQGIHVSLAPIVAGMPLELQSRVIQEVGDLSIFLPLESILPQLSKGRVSLPFAEVRTLAPQAFSGDRDHDAVEINIPLSVILPHISPDMLARRHGALELDIPDDIVSPFADKGRGLAIGAVKPARPAYSPTPQSSQAATAARQASTTGTRRTPQEASGSTAAPHTPAARPWPTPAPTSTTPKPQAAPAALPVRHLGQPTSSPVAGSSASKPASVPAPPNRPVGYPTPRPDTLPKPAADTGLDAALPRGPVQSPTPPPSVTERGTRILSRAESTRPQTTASVPSAAIQPASPSVRPPLVVSLSDVANSWPDSLKQEIVQLSLAEASLSLPYTVVEAGLKRGRLNFPWKQIRSWLTPEVSIVASVHDAAELELPLRVVAPLFVAKSKEQPHTSAKAAVDKDIPNLFFGLPQPDTTGVAVDHSVNRPLDTNYYVWHDEADVVPDDGRNHAAAYYARSSGTEFVTRYATPNEVVSRAAALDGIEGAVISLPDGLMVASQLPPELNGDTLAAFLPQLFAKVSQCTQELRMGQLNNLNFTVGNVPWKIFRVNALYFAAFGAKGQSMPTAKLAALAWELDHRAKA